MKCIYCGTDIVKDVDEMLAINVGSTEISIAVHEGCKRKLIEDFAKEFLRKQLAPKAPGAEPVIAPCPKEESS